MKDSDPNYKFYLHHPIRPFIEILLKQNKAEGDVLDLALDITKAVHDYYGSTWPHPDKGKTFRGCT